ncbi:MAG: DUF3320 domain-containing protein [Rhodopila sp.]|jgi:hypothetical protein
MLDIGEASTTLAALCGSDPLTIVDGASADWADALAAHLDAWRAQARHLRDWCAWRGLVQRADAVGVGGLLRAMEDGLVLPAEASRVFEVNYARWWIGLAVHGSVRLKSFVAAQHELQIQRFCDLDSKLLGLAAKLTRATLASAIPGQTLRERDPEYAVLARELAKRQRHLPVRQLAERMPRALRRLMPCLMMSPMSVAQYLPADAPPFDLVIFDEASQIPTWDAIGVIGRGRQVIIVGDPKQLPPTRFFERQVPGGDSEVGVGQTGDGQMAGVEVDIEDLESILDECLGAGIPSIDLQWHYRSRHESLIAFSNYRYYGGRLITFPAPRTVDRAVSFRHVTDGVYARAGARTNPAEARALVAEVVSVLRGILAGGTPRSIGVVTFNSEQQGLVENLLDEARREDPRLEPFFSDETLEPVMVKNLEGVQGEERDLMLFSLTYGPDQTGRVAMNFGPLNQGGGERRLNVAITRAREQLIVFGSLRPEHIDLSRSSSIGVSHLKEFLDYAINGARAFARAATGPLGDFESPFETAVAHRLAAKGWVLHPQIGVSGFRIDLGVVDPDASGDFLAGLECDGATYHSGATARDRDRLCQLVLERLGWRILRIWSTDWWTNAERECERLHAALEAALAERRAARNDAGQPGTPEAAAPVMDGLLLPGAAGGEDASDILVHSDPVDQEYAAVPDDDLPGAGTGATGDDAGMPTVDAARFYDDTYRDTLRAIVISELARSGPLRIDRLAQRVARRHGFLRTGREIQDRVSAAIPEACQRTPDLAGTFVWPIGVDPAAVPTFRELARGQQIDPADLPIEELTALARDCAARFPDQAAALVAMRDACGLAKLREASRERFLEALGRT